MNRSPRGYALRKALLGTALSAALFVCPTAAHAQAANIFGSLGNFDAANFEGQDAHGFEIQIDGVQPSDVAALWPGNKFGQPVVTRSATGIYVRYLSPFDPSTQQFTATTVPHAPGTPFAGTCYTWNPSYAQAGCDHFGVHLGYAATPTATVYRWMFADPANPGSLIASANTVSVPAPVWTFVPPPPTQPTAPPTLVAEIVAPDPPEVQGQYGDATWVRVFKTELDREVVLDELTSDNPIVPQDPNTQLETSWDLIQQSPPGGHKQRGKHVNQGSVNSGSRAIIRRYETYAYTGAYDPLTHEALCGGDGSCSAPLDGELGDMLGAQMAAVNVGVPSLTVAKVGNGSVSSTDKVLSCGSKCTSTYAIGTAVTLTASPGSGSVFTGWTGACAGTSLSCVVTVNDSETATATFMPQFTLSVGRSNPGTVTATPAGNDRVLSCGSACSAKFTQGTTVTLTATPPDGKSFLGWSGACSGTAPTCSMAIAKDTSVQASFSK
jgi:List-Bact-rpt repeat protein